MLHEDSLIPPPSGGEQHPPDAGCVWGVSIVRWVFDRRIFSRCQTRRALHPSSTTNWSKDGV